MGDRSIDDEDFDYGGQIEDDVDDDVDYGDTQAQFVVNQPHDEEVALSDTGSFGGDDQGQQEYGNNMDASLIDSGDDEPNPIHPRDDSSAGYTQEQYEPPQQLASHEDSDDPKGGYGQEEDDNYDDQYGAAPPAHLGQIDGGDDDSGDDRDDRARGEDAMGYNAQEFSHLNVSEEVRELFKYVGRYQPHTIDLDTTLKPFMPVYIPSVGGIDEFIKVPRPDGKPDYLGLKVLDEAASKQSDPTVLTLQLRQLSKETTGNNDEMVGSIEHTDANKMQKVQQWITSVGDIHKSKPPAQVSYLREMPDIDALMQEWPPEMEAFLKNMKMPSGELDLDLATFSKLVCGILDIPIYDNPIESLHVLFTLYLEFKNNPIFAGQQDLGMGMGMGDEGMASMGGAGESNIGGANVMTF